MSPYFVAYDDQVHNLNKCFVFFSTNHFTEAVKFFEFTRKSSANNYKQYRKSASYV